MMWTMPWPWSPHALRLDAELGGSWSPQRLDLRVGDRVLDGLPTGVVGTLWSSVAYGQVRAAHGAVGQPQALEGLRAGHLVDEVQVDVEQVGLALARPHHVAVPDLLGERLGHQDLGFLGVAVQIMGLGSCLWNPG